MRGGAYYPVRDICYGIDRRGLRTPSRSWIRWPRSGVGLGGDDAAAGMWRTEEFVGCFLLDYLRAQLATNVENDRTAASLALVGERGTLERWMLR